MPKDSLLSCFYYFIFNFAGKSKSLFEISNKCLKEELLENEFIKLSWPFCKIYNKRNII